MIGKPSPVHIIGSVTKQVEKLRVHDRNDKIECVIRIGDDDEHRRLAVSQQIKFHFVIAHDLPQLSDIEWCQPCTAGNKYALGGLAGSHFVFFILADSEVLRIF